MTTPHAALLQLVSSGEAGSVDDDETFLLSVHEHRMTAAVLLAHQQGRLSLPASVATTLSIWDLAERREHLRFWKAIEEVHRRLAPTGAEVAVLKGVATEARWYDEPGQRIATDVDLLLAPDVLDSAAELVAVIDPDRGMSASIDWLVRRRLLQHVDLHVGPVQVDLHFDPLKIGIPTRQIAEVWTSTQLLPTPHGMIRVLRPEMELVLFLLHLNKDSFAYLGPFLDVRQIVERAELDWSYLAAFVAEEGLAVPVFKSLAVVANLLNLDVNVLRPTGVRARTWDRLWGPRVRLRGDEGRLAAPRAQRLLAFHASRRMRDVVLESSRQLLPPRQLLEVAGYLQPGGSYLRSLTVDRLRADDRRVPAMLGGSAEHVIDYGSGEGDRANRVSLDGGKGTWRKAR